MLPRDELADDVDVAVIDVRIGDHVHEFSGNHVVDLCDHHKKDGVLADIPVVCRQHVLAPLIQKHIERRTVFVRLLRDVVGDGVGARVQVHFREVGEHIGVRHDPSGIRSLAEVKKDLVHLVEVALGITRLHADLIAVGLADGAVFIRPFIPNMGIEVMDIVGLSLVDP